MTLLFADGLANVLWTILLGLQPVPLGRQLRFQSSTGVLLAIIGSVPRVRRLRHPPSLDRWDSTPMRPDPFNETHYHRISTS